MQRTLMILKTAVGRARVGCVAVGWQGATTRRARARKAEQRRQRAAALPNRVRSAFTQKVMRFVCEILSVHQVLPAEVSGQLRFLGCAALALAEPLGQGLRRW